jgi:hypothetical protein
MKRFKALVDTFWQSGGTNTVRTPGRPEFVASASSHPAGARFIKAFCRLNGHMI